jgi:hypothetical protein
VESESVVTREEHLLTIIAEECVEIAKCATKSLRFGLDSCGPGQIDTNARLMCMECADLQAVLEMLSESNCMFQLTGNSIDMKVAMASKKAKVEKMLERSLEHGRLTE